MICILYHMNFKHMLYLRIVFENRHLTMYFENGNNLKDTNLDKTVCLNIGIFIIHIYHRQFSGIELELCAQVSSERV